MSNGITVLFLLKRVDCNDGVSSYLETLLTGMKANGDKAVIISGRVTTPVKTEPRRQALEAASEEWVILDYLSPRRLDIKSIKQISAIIKKHSVDVISPQGMTMLPFSFVVSNLTGKPVVANYLPSIHGAVPTELAKKRSLKKNLAYRLIVGIFPPWKFIAMSKDNIRFFREECGIGSKRIVYIATGIDSERYRPPSAAERKNARESLQLPDTALVCVLSGRLNFNKGHDLAIEAIRKLRFTSPELEIVCLFPGSGADVEAIRADARQDPATAGSFRFLGFVDDETLLNVYWAADIALLPSRLEGFGLAIAEAMACGAVPIRTPSGGWEDQIIEGETGFVIPFDDAAALAARIYELADENRRLKMRDSSIAHAHKNFRKDVMVSRTSELYRRALTKR
jgi:glycosyltransferase involved in cell wall biosynthesis